MTSFAYGITTCKQRLDDGLFLRTLKSLELAGFDNPRIFLDGLTNHERIPNHLECTYRYPTIRTYGNWILGIAELYIRQPNVDRYAMFQDDFVTYRNLREYLSKVEYPEKGYFNLYTFPSNQGLAPKDGSTGWYLSNQLGRGAVALIFDNQGVRDLLLNQHIIDRPKDASRGHRVIDGGIVEAMRKAGYKEYVHNPSLVQHTGDESSMGNKPHLKAISFRGEEYDSLELLESKENQSPYVSAEWEYEKTMLEEAIRQDKIRLEAAIDPLRKRHFERLIKDYENNLRIHNAKRY